MLLTLLPRQSRSLPPAQPGQSWQLTTTNEVHVGAGPWPSGDPDEFAVVGAGISLQITGGSAFNPSFTLVALVTLEITSAPVSGVPTPIDLSGYVTLSALQQSLLAIPPSSIIGLDEAL